MKQIILTEGLNDVILISKFFEEYDFRTKNFLREDMEGSSKIHRNKQDDCIRSFIEPRSPYDVLIKSEGGKDSLFNLICSEIISLVDRIEHVIIIRDLDDDSLDKISNIEKKFIDRILNRHKCGDFKINPGEIIERCSKLIAKQYDIIKNNNNFGQFILIIIKPDLESIAKITESDDRSNKNEKIGRLVEETEISDFLNRVIIY